MFPEENDNKEMEELEQALKEMWLEEGNPSVIAAKHAEFVVEPKVFFGNKLNPEILKLLVVNYLANSSSQDSGAGTVSVTPEKLTIKNPKGKPLVIVRDKKIIEEYLGQQA